MRIVAMLLVSLSLSAMMGGCASTSDQHTYLEPPTFEDPRLASYLAHLISQHEIFVNELDELRPREVKPVCSLDADESWALSGIFFSRKSSSPRLAIREVGTTLMEGGCQDGKAVAPYIAATRNHFVILNPDRPDWSSTND